MFALLILSHLNPLVATIIKQNFLSIGNLNKTLNDYPDYDLDYVTWPGSRSIPNAIDASSDQLQWGRIRHGMKEYFPLYVPGKPQRRLSQDDIGYTTPFTSDMKLMPYTYPRYHRAYMGHLNLRTPSTYSQLNGLRGYSSSMGYSSSLGYSYAGRRNLRNREVDRNQYIPI